MTAHLLWARMSAVHASTYRELLIMPWSTLQCLSPCMSPLRAPCVALPVQVCDKLYPFLYIHTEHACCQQVVKKPGQDNTPIMSEMDLTYKERYTEAYIPEAYERLILDAIRGDQQHFVRRYHSVSTACMPQPCQDEDRSPALVHRCSMEVYVQSALYLWPFSTCKI